MTVETPSSSSNNAERYFEEHPNASLVYLTDDGVVFDGDARGLNRCQLYCAEKKIEFQTVKK